MYLTVIKQCIIPPINYMFLDKLYTLTDGIYSKVFFTFSDIRFIDQHKSPVLS